MLSNELIKLENQFGAHNYAPLDVVLAYGRGVWVWDVDNNKYMDCLSAYSAVNQGHCHPRICKAMIRQAQKLTLTSRAFRNEQLPLFYQELCELTGSHKVLPMNSGAEAVESAIKAVRKWGYEVRGVEENKAEIIVFSNNFHGRTLSIISFSTDELARHHFGPYTPGFRVVPYGDIEAVKESISRNTVAILVEPVQGEAGVIFPPEGFLTALRELSSRYNLQLILDEIQTGLGRTGKLLAEEHYGIEADVTLLGKALSGGFYPVSAVLSNNDVLGVFQPGEHGSTFGGNPLACAIAREALKVLVEEGLVENASRQGSYLLAGLKQLDNPLIKEVRGLGLMTAIELQRGDVTARHYVHSLKRAGILVKDTHEYILRISPPLIITREEIDWMLDRLSKVFNSKMEKGSNLV